VFLVAADFLLDLLELDHVLSSSFVLQLLVGAEFAVLTIVASMLDTLCFRV